MQEVGGSIPPGSTNGHVAQLGERLVRNEEVAGAEPAVSTMGLW
jgi:hypothetical protein